MQTLGSFKYHLYFRQDCPKFSELPVADSGLKNFYGVRYYSEKGGSISSLACNGYYHDRIAGYRETADDGYGIGMGTLYVHHGCIMYAFNNYNY